MSELQRRGLASHHCRVNDNELTVYLARSFLHRALGLMGTHALSNAEGLWIAPCNSIHTFGMRYPIDVVFLSSSLSVLKVKTMKQNRVCRHPTATSVLELVEGNAKALGFVERYGYASLAQKV